MARIKTYLRSSWGAASATAAAAATLTSDHRRGGKESSEYEELGLHRGRY